MKTPFPLCGLLCAAVLMALPMGARADFANFGDFSGFSINRNDTGSLPTIAPNSIHITNVTGGEARSVFNTTLQPISHFTAQFTYLYQASSNNGMGAAFVLQNSPNGAQSVGLSGTFLGYGPGTVMTGKSIGVTVEANGLNPFSSGFYTNGSLGGGSASVSPVGIQTGDPIIATLTYNGTILHENLLDTVTQAVYNVDYPANLPSLLGSTTAYVGLTASTNNNGEDQTFSNFSFVTVPEPASLALVGIGATTLLMRRRRA